MPRFSVVVPTRDRPDLLSFCLESLTGQTFDDVEVVVSDNATTAPARHVYDRWARPGWRYLKPERPLSMHDNFELGCDEASGDYVAVVVDKQVLHPSALAFAARELEHEPVDIVSWWNEGYNPIDETRNLPRGRFFPTAASVEPTLYDAAGELARRFEFASRRGADHVHYVRGKIVFGAYSRPLLDRIRRQTGRVFHPLAPDYTSMVPGCALAEGALDLGRPLLLSYNSVISTGRRCAEDPSQARRFIEEIDPAIMDAFPIPGLYASQHNFVAYDLVSSASRLPAGLRPELDLVNLVARAREDLEAVTWSTAAERAAQYALLESAEARLGVVPRPKPDPPPPQARRPARLVAGQMLARAPRLEDLAYRAAGRTNPRRPFASPVEAAREADRHYSASAVGGG
jgi:hypothetical protein